MFSKTEVNSPRNNSFRQVKIDEIELSEKKYK